MIEFPHLKIYSGGRAPNPRRVQIFLAEKNITVPTEHLDINKLEQRGEEFKKINPLGRLPVLMLEDGTAISESVAICRYFEEMVPDPALFGRRPEGKAIVEMWQRRVELGFMMPVATAFRHLHPGAAHLESPQIAEWGKVNQPRAREFMEFLDEELAGRDFIAGGEFSIADITTFISYQFLKPARIGYPEDLPNLQRWFQDMSQRPSTLL